MISAYTSLLYYYKSLKIISRNLCQGPSDRLYMVSCEAAMTNGFFNCRGFNMNCPGHVLRALDLRLSDSVWRDHEHLRN